MLKKSIAVALLGCAGLASAQQMHPPGLGEKPDESSIAVDMNTVGQVAGIIEDDSGRQRAVLWDKRLIELGTLGGSDSYTKGINAGGDVVGSSLDSDRHWRAFVYRAGLSMRDLGTLGGGSSYGMGINRHGQAVGFSDTSDGYFRAFTTSGANHDGPLIDLGTLGGNISYAAGINSHGVIVGTAALPDGYRRAFIYRPDGGMTDLGTLGGRSSSATAVSDNGIVVGASETVDRKWHAFMHDGTKMIDLGALVGYGNSFATAVNSAGHVVGSVRIGDERRAFVYRDGKMTVHPGGFGLYLVNSINAEELVIGATYASKKYQAATMRSSKPAAVTHGGADLLTVGAGVISAAFAIVIYRRRYRGIVLTRFRFL
jgi:probable HAF family extracellular repeat protein